jgi:hypothetical protein
LADDFPGVRFLFFGFGDRHYLLAKEQSFPAMLAALWPGPGMMLVTGLSATPHEAFGAAQVIVLAVTPDQLQAAQRFVWDSLAKDQDASPGPHAKGPYQGSLYFSATMRYSAAHTCNTWAAEALHAASLPVRSRGVVFAGQLWSQAQRLAGAAARVPTTGATTPASSVTGWLGPVLTYHGGS